MIELLRRHFPPEHHYFARQRLPDAIDRFCRRMLYEPIVSGPRHSLWSPATAAVSRLGSLIGWVPESLPAVFFFESVRMELAACFAAAENRVYGGDTHIAAADRLLEAAGITRLAPSQPYSLSDGETKLVRFLGQLAKAPEYLIMSNPERGLSDGSLERLAAVISLETVSASAGSGFPVFILGCPAGEPGRLQSLLSPPRWRTVTDPLFTRQDG